MRFAVVTNNETATAYFGATDKEINEQIVNDHVSMTIEGGPENKSWNEDAEEEREYAAAIVDGSNNPDEDNVALRGNVPPVAGEEFIARALRTLAQECDDMGHNADPAWEALATLYGRRFIKERGKRSPLGMVLRDSIRALAETGAIIHEDTVTDLDGNVIESLESLLMARCSPVDPDTVVPMYDRQYGDMLNTVERAWRQFVTAEEHYLNCVEWCPEGSDGIPQAEKVKDKYEVALRKADLDLAAYRMGLPRFVQ